MSEIDFTNICTAYTEKIDIIRSFEDIPATERHNTSKMNSFKVLCLMFTTYPKNVPEPKEYTVEDMINLANDPVLISKYETPFCVMSLFHEDRPALHVVPHALVDLFSYMEQPSTLDNQFIVIKETPEAIPIVTTVIDNVTRCAIPEKYAYGCATCLSTTNKLTNSCLVRKCLGADNPSYNYGKELDDNGTDKEDFNAYLPIHLMDSRVIKPYGKYESPFNSRKTKIAGHLYVSPTMFLTKKRTYGRRISPFTGLRDIACENIHLDAYEDNLEMKQDALRTRKKHERNIEVHCNSCSVKETCHTTFKHKKKYCDSPYPPTEEIRDYFLKDDNTKVSKEVLTAIIALSGECSVHNPDTGRRCDAYLSVHNDMYGLGFRAVSRTTGKTLYQGNTDKDWFDFVARNNINTNISEYTKERISENLKDTLWYSKLLACTAIRYSPTRVTRFHSTAYPIAYVDLTYNGFSIKFLWSSQRRICPWTYEMKDWEDLFGHYGRIPGFR